MWIMFLNYFNEIELFEDFRLWKISVQTFFTFLETFHIKTLLGEFLMFPEAVFLTKL